MGVFPGEGRRTLQAGHKAPSGGRRWSGAATDEACGEGPFDMSSEGSLVQSGQTTSEDFPGLLHCSKAQGLRRVQERTDLVDMTAHGPRAAPTHAPPRHPPALGRVPFKRYLRPPHLPARKCGSLSNTHAPPPHPARKRAGSRSIDTSDHHTSPHENAGLLPLKKPYLRTPAPFGRGVSLSSTHAPPPHPARKRAGSRSPRLCRTDARKDHHTTKPPPRKGRGPFLLSRTVHSRASARTGSIFVARLAGR